LYYGVSVCLNNSRLTRQRPNTKVRLRNLGARLLRARRSPSLCLIMVCYSTPSTECLHGTSGRASCRQINMIVNVNIWCFELTELGSWKQLAAFRSIFQPSVEHSIERGTDISYAALPTEPASDVVGVSTRSVGSAARTFASTARIFGRGTRATVDCPAARGPDVKTGHVHITPKLQQFDCWGVERRRFQCSTTVKVQC